MASKRGFGSIRKLPSGRYQARYTGPDGCAYPLGSYGTSKQAELALSKVRVSIDEGSWLSPGDAARAAAAAAVTVADVVAMWLEQIPTAVTAELARRRMERYVLPALGKTPVAALGREDCDAWYRSCCPDLPTQQAACYSGLRSALNLAVDRDLIAASPLRIKGAGRVEPAREPQTVSDRELDLLVEAISPRYACALLIAAWCGLRAGEVLGLQRGDIEAGPAEVPLAPVVRIHIRRHVMQNLGRKPGEPAMLVLRGSKAEQKTETVVVPPHVVGALWQHLDRFVGLEASSWLFPMHSDRALPSHTSTLHRAWTKARKKTGLTGYIFHDLRRTGNTMAAESGATLAEMMQRLRHKSVDAAQAYLVAAHGADVRVAERISEKAQKPIAPVAMPPAPPPADPVEVEVQRRLEERLRELGIEPE